MSKSIWKFQSSFYHAIRKNPLSSIILTNENKTITSLLQMIQSGPLQSALDIGSGRGNSLYLLPDIIQNRIAVDNCFDMIAKTRLHFPQVQFIHAEADILPFRNSAFELIFCIGLSEYMANLQLLISNIYKMLTEGGYCIFTISPKSIFTYARYFWGHRIYPRNVAQIEEQIRNLNFTILGKTKTLLQNQYLIQK